MISSKFTAVLLGGFLTMGLMAGCAAKSGNIVLENTDKAKINDGIVNGKTTKAEVKTLMEADPQNVDFDQSGHEKWTYSNVRKSAKFINFIPVVSMFGGGTNDTTKTLVIVYDNNGIVLNHVVSQAEGETKVGLFQ